mmetsp:Transcript_66425/g.154369  ORF Transcript_66425/g.154369 Transcript_66425/m.154369 type:complete len:242 (-) Transcript_66425:257-982(-)
MGSFNLLHSAANLFGPVLSRARICESRARASLRSGIREMGMPMLSHEELTNNCSSSSRLCSISTSMPLRAQASCRGSNFISCQISASRRRRATSARSMMSSGSIANPISAYCAASLVTVLLFTRSTRSRNSATRSGSVSSSFSRGTSRSLALCLCWVESSGLGALACGVGSAAAWRAEGENRGCAATVEGSSSFSTAFLLESSTRCSSSATSSSTSRRARTLPLSCVVIQPVRGPVPVTLL